MADFLTLKAQDFLEMGAQHPLPLQYHHTCQETKSTHYTELARLPSEDWNRNDRQWLEEKETKIQLEENETKIRLEENETKIRLTEMSYVLYTVMELDKLQCRWTNTYNTNPLI